MRESIKARAISALLLAVAQALLMWLRPDLEPGMLGGSTPEGTMYLFLGIFLIYGAYLLIQGLPVSHGNIGSSSMHNLDNILSGVPAVVALFGVFIDVVGFWALSPMHTALMVMTLFAVFYDLFVLGGAAAKINRLTDEFKHEK